MPNSGGRSSNFLAAAFEAGCQPLAKPHVVCATEAITDHGQRKREGKERQGHGHDAILTGDEPFIAAAITA